jgi:membrane protein implicated in regulation of membrane protease activity
MEITPSTPPAQVAALIARSSFVLFGTVEAIGTSTSPLVRGGPLTMVVRVNAGPDAVLLGPGSFATVPGSRITVVFDTLGSRSNGSPVLELVQGIVLTAEGMAVREVAWAPAGAATAVALRRLLHDVDDSLSDAQVRVATDRASAVILGHVGGVARAAVRDTAARRRSHGESPVWWEATIRVERLFKTDRGRHVDSVRVLYPTGPLRADEARAQVVPDDRRVFSLRRASALPPERRGGVDITGRYFVVDSLDTLPPGDTVRVKRVLP